ncbi:HAMP domain-containing protein [Pleurocapsales cyanobacterium LEGE 10410]|nr:HAMP domain-containing protein [Pleurocapsales cyanobacterium LEGE 10410]
MINHEPPKADSNLPLKNNSTSKMEAQKFGWGKSLTLKTKATLLAIAIGTIPVLAIGGTAYYFANRSITRQIVENGETLTVNLQDKVNLFMKERFNDIQAMANLNVMTDLAATPAQKEAALERLKSAYDVYDSIAVFDLEGNPIAQTTGKKLDNHLNRTYIQAALQANGPVLSQPAISSTKGTFNIYAASTIKDQSTGKPIGFIRARIPVTTLAKIVEEYETEVIQFYVLNAEGQVFLGPEGQYVTQTLSSGKSAGDDTQFEFTALSLDKIFSGLDSIQSAEEVSTTIATNTEQNIQKIVSYTPLERVSGLPDLNWQAALATDANFAFTPLRQLGFTIAIGTGVTILLVAMIATLLVNRVTVPMIDAVTAVKKIGRGELDTRLAVTRQDELGELNANINLMAEQIQNSLQEQQAVVTKQRQEKEQLEQAIYTLIDEISDATDGDLTVRANLDSMELSTVADLFNAIIDNLQEIAIEAKQSSEQVGTSLKQNEQAIRQLAQQAITEAEETRSTLIYVEQMSQSIQTVAANASQAEQIADDTYTTALNSTNDMDSTVDSILDLRTTVSETAKKMQRLAESSQKISQAVTLIEEIALKTNVLAINAGAEADRAGEYGQGFSVVAEQVGALAKQSKTAIKEVASIVSRIQAETKEVRQAMESGTVQVVNTTRLVENTKQSLAQVLEKSQTINQLMESISQSTVSQADTSQNVTNLMEKIAQLSATTSQSSEEVAQSIVETAQVAQKLESTVAQFKVAESV